MCSIYKRHERDISFMVSTKSVEEQLEKIHFNKSLWNYAERQELPNILLPEEEIYECVNGTYEGGVALLVGTNVRLLLIDKKPFKFLTVEDLRFDMINQIDYSHRLIGARISISAGSKNLNFQSFNQQRLRKLIGHIQHCMAESKNKQSKTVESQQQHLEQINKQLQTYLYAQLEQQEELKQKLEEAYANKKDGEAFRQTFQPLRPDPTLSDYLFAQTLLKQYEDQQNQNNQKSSGIDTSNPDLTDKEYNKLPSLQTNQQNLAVKKDYARGDKNSFNKRQVIQPADYLQSQPFNRVSMIELYRAGRKEVFGRRKISNIYNNINYSSGSVSNNARSLEVNPIKVAYSKLPLALRKKSYYRRLGASYRSSEFR